MKKTVGIRTYLSLSYGLVLVLSLGAIGWIWSRIEYRVLSDELQRLASERATLLASIVSEEIGEHGLVWLEEAEFPEAQLTENMVVVYFNQSGAMIELVPGSVSPRQAEQFQQLNAEYPFVNETYQTLVDTSSEPTSAYAAAPVIDGQNQMIGRVCVLMSIDKLETYILRLRWLLMGAILIVALLGVGVSTLLTSYFSRQFSRAQQMAAMVTEGNYHLRIPEEGPTELHDLSHYLNAMAEKLQSQMNTRKALLANVAHELARPLAGLQIGIEGLRKGAIQDPNLADDLLVSMGQTVQRLGDLIDDITLAAQPVDHPVELNRAELAVEPFLKGVATRFWPMAENRKVRLEVRVDPDVPYLWADEKRLNQIVGNLVDNAIKFTPQGKVIRLSAERADEDCIRIMVQDGGKGLQSDEAEHLFEPFYQGELGRRIKQGMGLGLSIAHQLAQAHGGSLTLENHPAGGAIAILTLPTKGA